MGSADERRFEVLRAIVADFVSTKEPIGSKSLVERHNLGVSSATVRNDMAVLEAEGYIAQPHTSSGRVPTEKGYREFVDRLDDVKPLSSAERRAIQGFLESGVDLDDVLRRAVRLLAQLTRQVAVVQYPTLSTSTVRHLEVIALTPARLLMVVITDSGRVDQRIVELGDVIDEHQLSQLREMLGQALVGKKLSAASVAVADLAGRAARRRRPGRRRGPLGDGVAGVAGGTHRRTPADGRHRQSDPQRRRFRWLAAVHPGGPRGAGGGAAVAGGPAGSRQGDGAHRSRDGGRADGGHLDGVHRLRHHATPCTAVWVCWGPPGWTIRELSPALPRLPCISAKCWVLDDRAPAQSLWTAA